MIRTLFNRSSAKQQVSLARDDRGLSTVEYVILLVLVAVAGIVAWNNIGQTVIDKITGSDDKLKTMGNEKK